jgi:MoaA/NifB/PqqE/SkfB family radical SAM enzyme
MDKLYSIAPEHAKNAHHPRLIALQDFYHNAVEFYVTRSTARNDGVITPATIHPITTEIDLRHMLGCIASLRKQGTERLLISGDRPYTFSELPKLILGVLKLGIERVSMRLDSQDLKDEDLQLIKKLKGLDHILLVIRTDTVGEVYRDRSLDVYRELSDCDCSVLPVLIGDESLGEHILSAMGDLAAVGADAFLVGFPLSGIVEAGKQHFVSAAETRNRLVHAKYAWRKAGRAIGLFALPFCSLSFGEPIQEPSIPLIPVFNPFDTALYDPKPKPRLNYFSPDGRLGCMCPLIDSCPRMHKKSLPLPPGAHHMGIPDDYFRQNLFDPQTSLLRITFACNQSCRFCFVQHSQHEPSLEELSERLKLAHAGIVTISGGEPGLVPFLPAVVKVAKANGAHKVVLQTNAVLYASPRKTAEIAEAGVDQAFVSLHAHTAELSDRLTHLPGSFEKTLVGIDNLLALPLGVVVNIVIQEQNYRSLVRYVDWLCERFAIAKQSKRLSLNMALVGLYGSTDWRENLDLVRQDIPRLSDLRPYLKEAINLCFDRGLAVSGFETACGFPRCVLDNDPRLFFLERAIERDSGFFKGPQCATCRVNTECYGVRESYAAVYGTDELTPIK